MWRDLLVPEEGESLVLPWTGGRKVFSSNRTWKISGKRPPEYGWYSFKVSGRKARLDTEADPSLEFQGQETLKGYLAGNRFIPDTARVDPDPEKLIDQTETVYLVEPGLDRFSRATVVRNGDGKLIYQSQEFPEGPEYEVLCAYQDRKDSVDDVAEVSPALDLAFRWESRQRLLAEERARELECIRLEEERRRAEEERRQQLMKQLGTSAGRRELAKVDFNAGAEAALKLSGAELLDARPSRKKGEMVVQWRFRRQRFECVVEKDTLRIVDAGICLEDHDTGHKGDRYFTLESLPGVVAEAIDLGRLVVWRHV